MHREAQKRPNLRRRRLLWSPIALLVAGAGLRHLPAYAEETGPGQLPPSGPGPGDDLPAFIRSREAWGAAPPAAPYVPQTPRGVVLHHVGVPWYGRPSVEQYLRNIQAFHTGPERGWEDIAYHFLIDLAGTVWAGRPPEVRGNPSVYYDSLGLVLICLLGDYDVQVLAEAQVSAVSSTAAWLMRRFTLSASALAGHRDLAPTECPGTNVYQLDEDGSLTSRIQALLR